MKSKPVKKTAPNNRLVRCAILGLGRIGSTLEKDKLREKPASHMGAIVNHPRTMLVAGCDIDTKKLNSFQKDWHHIQPPFRTYTSLASMLQQETIDILHIATPSTEHFLCLKKIFNALLQHNKSIPLLILEKPLANTLKVAKSIVALTHQHKQAIIINHERRYALDYLHLKKQIQQKTYGNVLSIAARLYMGRGRSTYDILFEDGTHLLDILFFLTKDELVTGKRFAVLKSIEVIAGERSQNGKASMKQKSTQLNALAMMNGITTTFDVAGERNHLAFEMDFSFQNGFIRIGNGIYEEWVGKKSPYYEKMNSLVKTNHHFNKTLYFANMMEYAVRYFTTIVVASSSKKKKQDAKKKDASAGATDAYAALKAIRELLDKSKKMRL